MLISGVSFDTNYNSLYIWYYLCLLRTLRRSVVGRLKLRMGCVYVCVCLCEKELCSIIDVVENCNLHTRSQKNIFFRLLLYIFLLFKCSYCVNMIYILKRRMLNLISFSWSDFISAIWTNKFIQIQCFSFRLPVESAASDVR